MRHLIQYASTPGDSGQIPSGMDFDPNADEEIIDQQAGEQYPKPADEEPDKASNDLANSIAYAIDGSGPGPTGQEPEGPERKVIHEGITGAGPEDEEEGFRSLL
ncbi:hypothetical protein DYU11_05990 [Fibrisoma montanum]|uniref:Uncharacterized protein n=1 Tax=Fibrisoma montanum TaxID=2305895 RepID=A0A418MDQ5_9BACT|nr:hypothetical protein [Fibrisoma montanum]RIV24867.1 hypothetical protein DYU11_05990 [Fibrisoma montanum]